tara:strand:+ start:388 stop:813 length:426 start_codon:yes stop_codon:yes gene_type:complete
MIYEIPEGATRKQAAAIAAYNASIERDTKIDVCSVDSGRCEEKTHKEVKPRNQRIVVEGQRFRTAKGGATVYEFGPAFQSSGGFTKYTFRKAHTVDPFDKEITHEKLAELEAVTHSILDAKDFKNYDLAEELEKNNHIIYV